MQEVQGALEPRTDQAHEEAEEMSDMGEKSCENCRFWHGDELSPRKACTAHEGFCKTVELEHWDALRIQGELGLQPRPEVEKR
jgi:hypothetical protein